MKANRFWIELVTLCTAIACALSLLLAIVSATGAVVAEAQSSADAQPPTVEKQTYEGMITDAHCGAKHQAAIGKSAEDCTRACVHGGSKFALVDGDKTYILDGDLNLLKNSAGRRAKITGARTGNTIKVTTLESAT
jgi:hypothetical protein